MTGDTPEAVTREELEWVLKYHSSALKAKDLISEIKGRREPEYEPGAVYRDPEGRLYLRTATAGWLWLDPIDTAEPRPDDWVERPLRKLVPEGSQDAAGVLAAEWRRIGEALQDPAPPFRDGYHAALRKCADELEAALKGVI